MATNTGRSNSADVSLYDLLWERYALTENYLGQRFLCLDTVEREFDYERLAHWIKQYPLHRVSQQTHHDADLIHIILKESRLLFATLVLGGLERLLTTLVLHGFSDAILFSPKLFKDRCADAQLTQRERNDILKYRQRIGAVLGSNRHEVFPQGTVLPYRNINHPKDDRFGGFGVVQRVEIAAGHLQGYHEVGLRPHPDVGATYQKPENSSHEEAPSSRQKRRRRVESALS